eukprot:gene3068-3267_t
MAETENDQVNTRSRSRTRRSALTDISNFGNTIVEKFTKRISTNTKKRKFQDEDGPAAESEVIANEIEAKEHSTVPPQPPQPTSSITDENSSPNTVNISNKMPAVEVEGKGEKVVDDVEFDRYGFYQPPKIQRKLPIYLKGADPKHCLDIIDDLYAFYVDMETVFAPKNYFERQSEVTARMRTILVDWIIEVHYKYHLTPATLWTTVNIMDRYLEKHDIARGRLQLVGITALFLACKFEEIHSPQVNDCVYLTDNAYKKEEILAMEASILQTLDYQLMVPTGLTFLTRYLNRIKATERVRLMASYAAERNLQELEVFQYSPRIYAAACVYIALYAVHVDQVPQVKVWTSELEEEANLKECDILPCAKALMVHLREIPQASTRRKLDSARKKYSTAQTQFIGEYSYPNL